MKQYNENSQFLFLIFGFILGAAVIGAAFLFGGVLQIVNALWEFDGIIGSLIALVGAGATVAIVNLQIRTAEKRHESDNLDKLRAAKSVLPIALSQISQFAANAAKNISELIEDDSIAEGKLKEVTGAIMVPVLPLEATHILKENIQFAHKLDGKFLAEICVKIQICYSRLVELEAKISEKKSNGTHLSKLELWDVRGRIVDAIELHANVGRCFNYARGTSTHIDKNDKYGGLGNAAMNCKIYDGEFPAVWEILNKRIGEV